MVFGCLGESLGPVLSSSSNAKFWRTLRDVICQLVFVKGLNNAEMLGNVIQQHFTVALRCTVVFQFLIFFLDMAASLSLVLLYLVLCLDCKYPNSSFEMVNVE